MSIAPQGTFPTLQRLIFNVRNLLNQPDRNNSFWSDEELTEYINEGIRVYFLELSLTDEGFFSTTATGAITSGVETVPLPVDCFSIRAVYKFNAASNSYTPLAYINDVNIPYTTQGGNDSNTYNASYHFRDNNIVLRPTPQFTDPAALLFEYIQVPSTLRDSTDYSGGAAGAGVAYVFKQIIEMYAVYKAKIKESLVNNVNTAAIAEGHLSTLFKQFKDTIILRSKYPTYTQPFSPEY